MNRETVLSPSSAAQSAQPATIAFTSGSTPERVVEQLDQLANSLESIASQRGPAASTPAAEDEECLESYLQRYMQQLTGKSAENSPDMAANNRSLAATTVAKSPAPAVEPAPAPQRQTVPAPEDRVAITAMRELANASTRRAIAESSQVQLVVTTRTTYLAARAVTLVSSTLAVIYFPTRSTVALACATAFFGIACLLGIRFLGLCRKLGQTSPATS